MGSKRDNWPEENKDPKDCQLINDLNFPKALLSVRMYALLSSLPSISLSEFYFFKADKDWGPDSSHRPSWSSG